VRRQILRGLGFLTAIFMAALPLVVHAGEAQVLSGQLTDQNRKAAEADAHVNDIDAQIAVVQAQINDTQTKISQTNAGIADAKACMADGQHKLNNLVRHEYQRNRESKLEMLASSSDFSEFVDRDVYIKTNQNQVAEAVDAILVVKKELDAKAADLAKLNAQLAAAQQGLAFSRAQAQNQLDVINAAREDLKKKLARYGGQVVSAGDRVGKGDLIGFEGTSGCSTGPHLHFEVQQNGSPVNPRNLTPGNFGWPLDAGFGVNQEFGRPNWSAPYSFHTGIDMTQYFGAPVYAAAAGTVIFAGYDRTGFGDHVIIDHGGGTTTIYGHMGARAADYPNC
jgi:septal ring factor EnvC (AmiA/AmiB activator)